MVVTETPIDITASPQWPPISGKGIDVGTTIQATYYVKTFVGQQIGEDRRVRCDDVLGLIEDLLCFQQFRDQLDSARVDAVFRLFESDQRRGILNSGQCLQPE